MAAIKVNPNMMARMPRRPVMLYLLSLSLDSTSKNVMYSRVPPASP